MVREHFEGTCWFAYVPELGLAVVPTRGQVVLFVGVEVQISHQLAMRILYTVGLSATTQAYTTQTKEKARLYSIFNMYFSIEKNIFGKLDHNIKT